MYRRFGEHLPDATESKESGLKVWRFPLSFSQSKLGGRKTTSNACTIIAIKVAEEIVLDQIKGIETQKDERSVVHALANGILDGNMIHEKQCTERNLQPGNQNFTIPDALKACQESFVEVEFFAQKGAMASSLYRLISKALVYWEKTSHRRRSAGTNETSTATMTHPPHRDLSLDLQSESEVAHAGPSTARASRSRTKLRGRQNQMTLLLICHERTVLVTFFPHPASRLAVIDSHSHMPHGAIICTGKLEKLKEFCEWIEGNLFEESHASERGFELSLIIHESHSDYGYHKEKEEHKAKMMKQIKGLMKKAA